MKDEKNHLASCVCFGYTAFRNDGCMDMIMCQLAFSISLHVHFMATDCEDADRKNICAVKKPKRMSNMLEPMISARIDIRSDTSKLRMKQVDNMNVLMYVLNAKPLEIS